MNFLSKKFSRKIIREYEKIKEEIIISHIFQNLVWGGMNIWTINKIIKNIDKEHSNIKKGKMSIVNIVGKLIKINNNPIILRILSTHADIIKYSYFGQA